MNTLESKRAEFFRYVWDHSADLFQVKFNQKMNLDISEIKFLECILEDLRLNKTNEEISRTIKINVQKEKNLDLLSTLLQLLGLTRTKIIGDLKASEEIKKAGYKVPNSYKTLCKGEVWSYAGDYLSDRIRVVFNPICKVVSDKSLILETLNQATYPGFIRQERAKRQGHEAEQRLATLLSDCGIKFEPEEKSLNPMCRDAQICGASFDLVIPSVANPLICFKATVHTANIGQYGESKDDLEIKDALKKLDNQYGVNRPKVIALIDGNGFSSNRAGLDGVLTSADEFCQFRTIWKSIVIAASQIPNIKREISLVLPQDVFCEFKPFLIKYGFLNSTFVNKPHGEWREVTAGDGKILISSN